MSPSPLLILSELGDHRRVWDEAIPILRSRGVEPVMGTVFGEGELHEAMRGLGVEAFSLGCRSARDYPRGALRLRREARRHDAQAVHAIESIPGFVTGIAGRIGMPAVTGFSRQHIVMDNARLNRLCRWAERLCDVTLACSEGSARAAVRDDGAAPDRIRVVHNAANHPRAIGAGEVEALKSELGIAPDAAVISVVARLRPVKGLDLLLDALPTVAAALDRELVTVIAGDGESRAALEQQAATLDTRVLFVGSKDDVALWYALGDVVTMPSHREGFPVAALEAMAVGRPLVTSDGGGLPEAVLDGVTGRVVPVGDAAALARALAGVLRDPAAAAEMGRRGRERFERHFTNEHMVDGWLAAYDEFARRT